MLGARRAAVKLPPASRRTTLTDDERVPSTGIALPGPRELVVAAEPPDWLSGTRYGVDLTVVPRSHIRGAGWSRGSRETVPR
jgi:hypothetical protein